ncbi:MAG: hypothetical protein JW857_09315 [Bacteroidales bacterium]|nr:hypothetical protein [Bacteroidales bacterium]
MSASKLGTLCTSTVPEGTIEFEPFFSYATTTKAFDSDGQVYSLFSSSDSTMKFSASGFRFSYGLIENLEIGVSLPIDVSEIRFGAKYKLPLEGKFSLGLITGYNSIVGNQIYNRKNAIHESAPSAFAGLVMTYVFNPQWSVDLDAQYQKHTHKTINGHNQGIYLNSDIGYYFLENVNFIIGLNFNYQCYDAQSNDSYLLSLNTGVAIERAKNFILVLNAPFDILGKNEFKTKGFGLALTIMLD